MIYLPRPEDLKRLRVASGLTQAELAKKVGVSQSLIAKIESGAIDPKISLVEKIIGALLKSKKRIGAKAIEIATKPLIYVKPDDNILKCIDLMISKGISQLPVIEENKNLGSVTESCIIKRFGSAENLENLVNEKVSNIMGKAFPVIDGNSKIDEILPLLESNSAVLVAEKGKIVGIITKADILRLLI